MQPSEALLLSIVFDRALPFWHFKNTQRVGHSLSSTCDGCTMFMMPAMCQKVKTTNKWPSSEFVRVYGSTHIF